MLRIDFFRKKRGLTVDELATRIGTTRGNLQKIKKKKEFSSDWLLKLSKVLEVAPGELLPLEWQSPADIDENRLGEAIKRVHLLNLELPELKKLTFEEQLHLIVNYYKKSIKITS